MENKRFNSKEEINEYIKNNSTSFKEFEKRLDYSILGKNKKKKHNPFSLKKLAYALASLVLVIGLCIGGYFAHSRSNDSKCPYELGTYIYYSQEGDIEGLDFSDKSYIIITDKELSGPGTFVLQDKDWTVYGQFYECEFENVNLKNKGNNVFSNNIFLIEIETWKLNGNNQIIININQNSNKILIYFQIEY